MIQKIFNLTLDTKRGVIESPIVVVKGDTGNVFNIRVQDNGIDLDLSGAAILVAFRGAHGGYTQDMETGGVTVDGAVVSFPLYKDAVSEGTNSCDIQIYTDGVLTTTAAFTFECRPATVGEDSIRADASLPILLELIQEMMDACDRYPTIEVEDIPHGHRILIYNYAEEAVTCDVMDGISGVYVGSGDMPDGFNVQIDPDGSASSGFIPEPVSEGTDRQVLMTDGLGGRTWGSVSASDITGLPTALSDFTDDLGSSPTHTHSQYLTSHQDISGKVNEPASEGTSGQVLATDGDGGRYWKTESGGGGSSDYDDLDNKPSINSVTLSGNSSSSDLGLADETHSHTVSDVTDFPTDVSTFTNDAGYLTSHQDISGKLDASHITHETWTFKLTNNTTVTKDVVLWL